MTMKINALSPAMFTTSIAKSASTQIYCPEAEASPEYMKFVLFRLIFSFMLAKRRALPAYGNMRSK